MRLRLLKPYGLNGPGHILTDVDPPVAELLIARGKAEAIDDAGPVKLAPEPENKSMASRHSGRTRRK